jgi:monoamine oxidase
VGAPPSASGSERVSPDVVVIGAGAAGLAAARTARAVGLEAVVLEAKGRIGGRAWTDTQAFGVPVDHGGQWLHSAATNSFARFAEAQRLPLEREAGPFRLWSGEWDDPALLGERATYFPQAFAAVEAAGEAGLDVAAADVIPPHPRLRAMLDSWFAALSGVEPERMSTLDYARYREDGGNWRIPSGYGALLTRRAAGVPVALSMPALRIDWSGPGVVVATPRGDLRARATIVTVSTSALAAGRIAFTPALPLPAREALAAVPLGEANKVIVGFARNPFASERAWVLHFAHASHEAIRFQIRPFGQPLAIGYLGGRFAAEIEAAGADAMADFALERLVAAFGAAIRRDVAGVVTTGWCGDPDIRGGYSCALPGKAHLRPVLAEPVGERLLFAGEACSLEAFGTVHGAWASGEAAAHALAVTLSRAPLAAS